MNFQPTKPICIIVLFFYFSFSNVFAQEINTSDRILLNSGEVKTGKVDKITDDIVTFHHEGESLQYDIPTPKINKIEYGTGRIEFFNPQLNYEDWESRIRKHHNKVAVLPFVYIDNYSKNPSMSGPTEIQSNCIAELEKVTKHLHIQAQDSTNATLIRHGISKQNINDYMPADIAHILEVEYVVYGTVKITPLPGAEEDPDYFGIENQTVEDAKGHMDVDEPTMMIKRFESFVDLNYYNELGEKLYSRAQESFWQSMEGYNINLNYLIVSSPFYLK